MADNGTHTVICRYFKNGHCREGNNCRFRHIQGAANETISPVSSVTKPCIFFKHGICKFGNHCHFRHSAEPTDTSSNASSPDNSSTGQRTPNVSPSMALKNNGKESAWVAEEWINAPEFVPSFIPSIAGSSSSSGSEASATSGASNVAPVPISYAQAVNRNEQASGSAFDSLCPYAEATGICETRNCTYLHGDICDLCNRAVLHPHNEELRKKHTNACVKQHEVDMELSFAIQRSREKSCGVCFEIIMEKATGEQRFGILPNCNHCFCLSCIRKWRQAKQFDNKIIRACPECRVTSDFVCPSVYWVDTKEGKEKLILDYKGALSTKECKYFNKGRGKCPFGNKCFYLHALPDGTKTDVGPPVRQRRNADTNINFFHQILWDFIENRDDQWMYLDFEDVPFLSDSEESDWSDQEL